MLTFEQFRDRCEEQWHEAVSHGCVPDPFLLMVTPKGHRYCEFDHTRSPEEKREFVAHMRATVKEFGAVRYAFITSAFASPATNAEIAAGGPGVPPSEHPDRQLMAMLQVVEPGRAETILWPIIRDKSGAPQRLGDRVVADEAAGLFSDLFASA